MKKQVKRIAAFLMVMAVFTVFMTTALAADTLQTTYSGWSIPGDSDRSGIKTWTATKSATSTKTNMNIYAITGARVQNTGAETTYFMAVPSASAPTCDRIIANGTYNNKRGFNWSCTQGTRYGLWHQRWDTTLNTTIINGVTKLYIK